MLPSPKECWLGLRGANFRGHYGFTCVTARRLAHHPIDGFVNRLQESQFPSFLLFKLQGFDFYPGGTHLPLITPAFAGHTLFHPRLHAGLSRRLRYFRGGTQRLVQGVGLAVLSRLARYLQQLRGGLLRRAFEIGNGAAEGKIRAAALPSAVQRFIQATLVAGPGEMARPVRTSKGGSWRFRFRRGR